MNLILDEARDVLGSTKDNIPSSPLSKSWMQKKQELNALQGK